jgi:hypothetical protein
MHQPVEPMLLRVDTASSSASSGSFVRMCPASAQPMIRRLDTSTTN